MIDDWDCEWPRLNAAEQEAFEAHMAAQQAVTIRRHHPDPELRAPDFLLLRDAAEAERIWRAAEAACDRFLTAYRKAA
jgi:hypothetical protein